MERICYQFHLLKGTEPRVQNANGRKYRAGCKRALISDSPMFCEELQPSLQRRQHLADTRQDSSQVWSILSILDAKC